MRQFFAYIDDSGEKEYGEKTSRYFVYAAVVVPAEAQSALVDRIDAAKIAAFGRPDVELKSNWVRIPKERQHRYLDRFKISAEQLTACVDEVYGVLCDERVDLLAAVIDKQKMQEDYGARAFYPSSWAYTMLLQRYTKHCEVNGRQGLVTIDQMTGASPKNNQWRELLKSTHKLLKRDGCRITKARFDPIADHPRFADSAKFALLQAADFVAYNVLRQFRDFGEEWDAGPACSVYTQFARIVSRFCHDGAGVFDGYGLVKFPTSRTGRYRRKI